MILESGDHRRDEWLLADDRALLRQCAVDTYRASGPGGQKRNKTDSAVRLRHNPTGLMVIATESRSQHENKARAVKRLRQAIALNVRCQSDRPAADQNSVIGDCIGPTGRLTIGKRDSRRNQVIAEVLDVLVDCEARVSEAAKELGITTANLVAFLQTDDKLWSRVNELRSERGLRPIR